MATWSAATADSDITSLLVQAQSCAAVLQPGQHLWTTDGRPSPLSITICMLQASPIRLLSQVQDLCIMLKLLMTTALCCSLGLTVLVSTSVTTHGRASPGRASALSFTICMLCGSPGRLYSQV